MIKPSQIAIQDAIVLLHEYQTGNKELQTTNADFMDMYCAMQQLCYSLLMEAANESRTAKITIDKNTEDKTDTQLYDALSLNDFKLKPDNA
jgi:hypothetical protein